MRRRIAEHMTHSVTAAPHVTAVFEADFSAIAAHRARAQGDVRARKASTSLTPPISSQALRRQRWKTAPAVNGRWFDDRVEIYDDVNIGIGTALGDKGLDRAGDPSRADAVAARDRREPDQTLTANARAGKLAPADVRGGTFSISNHGVSGSLVATPIIINQPQSAILGVGKLREARRGARRAQIDRSARWPM